MPPTGRNTPTKQGSATSILPGSETSDSKNSRRIPSDTPSLSRSHPEHKGGTNKFYYWDKRTTRKELRVVRTRRDSLRVDLKKTSVIHQAREAQPTTSGPEELSAELKILQLRLQEQEDKYGYLRATLQGDDRDADEHEGGSPMAISNDMVPMLAASEPFPMVVVENAGQIPGVQQSPMLIVDRESDASTAPSPVEIDVHNFFRCLDLEE